MNHCSGSCSSVPLICAVAIAPTGTGTFQSGNHGSSNHIRGAPHCGSKVLFGSEYFFQNIACLIWGSGPKVMLGMNHCSCCQWLFSLTMCAVAVATGTENFQSGNHGSSNQIWGAPHCGPKLIYLVQNIVCLRWGSEQCLLDLGFRPKGPSKGQLISKCSCNCTNRYREFSEW